MLAFDRNEWNWANVQSWFGKKESARKPKGFHGFQRFGLPVNHRANAFRDLLNHLSRRAGQIPSRAVMRRARVMLQFASIEGEEFLSNVLARLLDTQQLYVEE